MTDQFDQPVPNDLVVLAIEPARLTEDELRKIDALDWYVPDPEHHQHCSNTILVSRSKLNDCIYGFFDHYLLEDAGLKKLRGVNHIASVLHRWSDELFYHA
jgi:hypothetical protein